MRQLTIFEHISLDGVIQASDDGDGFPYREWSAPYRTPEGREELLAAKYVVTHRPESLAWGPAEAIGPEVAGDLRRIKATEGPELTLWGSSTLASLLMEQDVVDEVMLIVYPVLLVVGKRFFAERSMAMGLELLRSRARPSGVVLNRYRVARPLQPVQGAGWF